MRQRYFVTLLLAYGVDSSQTSLRWAEEIEGVGLDWPLGAVIRATCDVTDGFNQEQLDRCRGM